MTKKSICKRTMGSKSGSGSWSRSRSEFKSGSGFCSWSRSCSGFRSWPESWPELLINQK